MQIVNTFGFGLALILAAVLPAMAQEAEKLYLDKCANCHSPDGSGQSLKGKKMGLKDLRSPDVQKKTDAQMLELIVKGKGDMPGYAKELDDRQSKLMVEYMRILAKTKK